MERVILIYSIQAEKPIEKDHLNTIESKSGCVKQLILDMSVCWSSTYGMLHRAITLWKVSRKAFFFQILTTDLASRQWILLFHIWQGMSLIVQSVQNLMSYNSPTKNGGG